MRTTRTTTLGGILRGAAAGALGTLAMDLLLYARHRRGGGTDPFPDWELSRGTQDWEHAATPGLVGRLAVRKLLHVDLSDGAAAATTNVVHWATGIQWGAAYGMVAAGRAGARSGLLLGLVACSASYVVLPILGLYRPPWEYEAEVLARDYGAHLVYGVVTGASFWALTRRG